MEEESFKGRVDKIFGSLTSFKSSPSASIPPWSLTDDEVERREWNRRKDNPDRDDQTPSSSSFNGLFDRKVNPIRKRCRNNLEEEDPTDDEDEDEDEAVPAEEEEEWEIRSSIGGDCTLDFEEEEDAYDKMAEGRENAGDRVYMKDVTDHGPYLNSHNVLVDDLTEDFGSNSHAAKISLEDFQPEPRVTEKCGSNPVCDDSLIKLQEPRLIERKDGTKVKSILKRKSDAASVKSSKRVKFDPSVEDEFADDFSEKFQETLACPSSTTGTKVEDEESTTSVRGRVPDYIINPSKYTRYSFDTSDNNNEETNIRAYMDFLKRAKSSKATVSENMSESISGNGSDKKSSVVFIPRKKEADLKEMISDGRSSGKLDEMVNEAAPVVGIAVKEVQSVMEEDEATTSGTDVTCRNPTTSEKGGRRYRVKSCVDEGNSS